MRPSTVGRRKSGAGLPIPARTCVVVAVLAESRVSANPSTAAGMARQSMTNATRATRPGRRPRSVDEGVDGNSDEDQHEIDVRPAEELDRVLRRRVTDQRERTGHEHHTENEHRDRVEPPDV